MVEWFGDLILVILAVVVMRGLLGIKRGRWITTLIAVLAANLAALFIIRSVYPDLSNISIGGLIAAWALLTVFAMLIAVLIELLSGLVGRRPSPGGLLHPIRRGRLWAKRVVRYGQVGKAFVRSGLLRPGRGQGEVAASRLGRSLRGAMEDAGGLFVKLGQALAQQPQLVTPAVAEELAKLQGEASPADPAAARAVITEDIGSVEDVFAEISSTPLGAASIAQTYLARLHDGREVVVKVQRPGVAEDVQTDLDILHRLGDRLDHRYTWARSAGLKEVIAGFDERTREELDFRIEGGNQIAARRALRDSDPVRIPDVIDGFTTARVLVEERAAGRSIGTHAIFEGWDSEGRQTLADALLSLTLRQMLSGEPFHADPHPGNVFLRPDGRLELIDFGAVGRLDPFERSGLVDLLRGMQTDDPTLMREGVLRIATASRRIDEEALDRELARLASRSVRPDGSLNPKLFEDILFVLRDFGLVLPRSTTSLFRTLATLIGTLQTIAPSYRVMEAAQRVGGEVVGEQITGMSLQQVLMTEAAKQAPILRRLPRELDSIARRLLRGDLRARVSLLSEPDDVRVARGMMNRLVMGVVGGALALSSAVLLSASSAPAPGGVRIVNLLGGIGLFFSVVLLLRLVVQIVRDRD